jgi:hypothetical protein
VAGKLVHSEFPAKDADRETEFQNDESAPPYGA